MWMSSMTSGGKVKLCPRTWVLRLVVLVVTSGCGASPGAMRLVAISSPSEHQLLLGRLEIVVVPELLAGDDLLHVLDATGGLQAIDPELAPEPGHVELGEHRLDRV